jgi:transposase
MSCDMSINGMDIPSTIKKAREALEAEESISSSTRAIMEVLLLLITVLSKRLGINSSNSSTPPSKDPNRLKKKRKKKSDRKPGGQVGRKGKTLIKIDDPDEIIDLKVDRRKLPKGHKYRTTGFKTRQIFDLIAQIEVTEYRAEVLTDELGNRYEAQFPEEVTQSAQYGPAVKANAVYMSYYQMIPLARVEDNFHDQLNLPISKGSIHNFGQNAYDRLEEFELWLKQKLRNSSMLHADETGVNINGKNEWVHVLSNEHYSLFHVDEKRGADATDAMGVLQLYSGKLCHDHWKPYFSYEDCLHCLCNAHHLRELESAIEDDQKWAVRMQNLLLSLNEEIDNSGGRLDEDRVQKVLRKYRAIIKSGEKENPLPVRKKGQRGRLKKSKSLNLLERLRDYEDEVLRFMKDAEVPFTNNQAENDLRMIKVHQKVSGCFRSRNGARIFARVRSYISTCRKQGLSPTDALTMLFKGDMPPFVKNC